MPNILFYKLILLLGLCGLAHAAHDKNCNEQFSHLNYPYFLFSGERTCYLSKVHIKIPEQVSAPFKKGVSVPVWKDVGLYQLDNEHCQAEKALRLNNI